MKLKFTICLILFAAIGLYSAKFNPLHSRKNQPPLNAVSGAPGNNTCGSSSCHNNSANTGPGLIGINFDMGSTTYLPGNTYNLTVTVEDSTKSIWGFEAVAFDNASNAQVGTFITTNNTSNASLSIQNSGGIEYAGHKNANTATSTWTMEWVAPTTNVGDLTFYVAGIAGNDNNGRTGDNLYANNFVISADPTSFTNVLPEFVKVFPIPAQNEINIASEVSLDGVKLYNATGKLVYNHGTFLNHQVEVNNLANGLYFLEVEQNNTSYQQKILISK